VGLQIVVVVVCSFEARDGRFQYYSWHFKWLRSSFKCLDWLVSRWTAFLRLVIGLCCPSRLARFQ